MPALPAAGKHTVDAPVPIDRPMVLLAFAFAAAWVVFGVRPALFRAGARQFSRGAWSVSLPAVVL